MMRPSKVANKFEIYEKDERHFLTHGGCKPLSKVYEILVFGWLLVLSVTNTLRTDKFNTIAAIYLHCF